MYFTRVCFCARIASRDTYWAPLRRMGFFLFGVINEPIYIVSVSSDKDSDETSQMRRGSDNGEDDYGSDQHAPPVERSSLSR